MKTNALTWGLVAVIVLGGGYLLFNSTPGQAPTNSSSAISVDRTIHDFGEIDIYDGTVQTDFVLTNEGSDDVVIIAGTTSCGCTSGEIDGVQFGMHEQMSRDVVIAAGESKTLTAIFDPLAHGPAGVGLANRILYLQTNSTATPEIEARITALVVNNNQ